MTNADPPATRLLTSAEAADALKVSVATLYRYVREGRLAAIKHGRSQYIDEAEIAAYWSRLKDQALKTRANRARATAHTKAPKATPRKTPAGRTGGTTAAESRRTAA
jgi:excisionase family DNA binding protein